MDRKLKIFYITPEVAPFAGSSDIAAISSSLPKALKENGHEIRVMTPNYKAINPRRYILRDVIRLKDLSIKLGDEEILFNAKSAFLPNSKVQIYFLDQKEYYGRNGLYADPKNDKPFKDNAKRFAVFCLGCLETLRMLHWQPDIIHCSDWQAAMIPIYLKTLFKDDPFFQDIKIAFSVFDYDSINKGFSIQDTGLSEGDVPEQASDGGEVRLLNAGVIFSDKVITKDDTFQAALEQNSSSDGGQKIFEEHNAKAEFLVEAEDQTSWNPASDDLISAQYDLESFSNKEKNKKALLEQTSIEYKEGSPLIVLDSVPSNEKSFTILGGFLHEALDRGSQVIVAVESTDGLDQLKALAEEFSEQMFIQTKVTPEFEHQMTAGADFLFIPCYDGSVKAAQFYSLRYGTVPIVKANAGFNDIVQDFHKNPDAGAGFLFLKEDKNDLAKALDKALDAYEDSDRWKAVTSNVMGIGSQWHSVAPKYVNSLSLLIGPSDDDDE